MIRKVFKIWIIKAYMHLFQTQLIIFPPQLKFLYDLPHIYYLNS